MLEQYHPEQGQQKNEKHLRNYLRMLLNRKETVLPVSLISTAPGINKIDQENEKQVGDYLRKLLNRDDTVLPVIVINPEPAPDDFYREDKNHLRNYLRILWSRKWLIFTITFIAFLTSALSYSSKPPLYTASTQFLVQVNMEVSRKLKRNSKRVFGAEFLSTQLAVMGSYNVAHRIVKNLQLDTTYRQYFLKKHKQAPSPLHSISSTVVLFFSNLFPWTSTPDNGNKNSHIKISSESKTDAGRIAAKIQKAIRTKQIGKTQVVRLSYGHSVPFIAQMVTNGLIAAYSEELRSMNGSSTRNNLQWMTSKVEEERKNMATIEENLQQYMQEQDIVTVENKLVIYPERLSRFSSALSGALAKEKKYEAIYQQIKKAGRNDKALETIPLFVNNSVLQTYRSQIFISKQNIKELQKQYGQKHPAIIQAKAELDLLSKEKKIEMNRFSGAFNNDYELAQTSVKDLSEMVASTKAEIFEIKEKFIQYTALSRESWQTTKIVNCLTGFFGVC